MNQHIRPVSRVGLCVGAAFLTAAAWAQQTGPTTQPRKDASQAVPAEETPIRRPPTTVDTEGKSVPTTPEKLVLADPDSKMYMPCRGPNDIRPDDDGKGVKPNPRAAVMSEEAAKQHGFKGSAHKVDCPE